MLINFTDAAGGLIHRDDAVQHIHTPLIQWHGPTGTIFSVDIQPKTDVSKCQRIATAGSDNRVQIWELSDDEAGIGFVQHLSELSRHDCSVNIVRFHPFEDKLASASDDRCLFIWSLDTASSDAPDIFSEEEAETVVNKENWTVIKQIRGHGSEVYDLAWSPAGDRLVCGTMDNTSYVWDTTSGKKLALWQHHKGYVQGVAWDRCNKFIATLGCDRAAMIYNAHKLTHVQKIYKMEINKGAEEKTKNIRIFLDSGMVDTFFRRPDISPDGKILAFPTGCFETEADDITAETAAEDKTILINVVYFYNHNNFEQPALCLPTGASPAIAVRFCPKLFSLRVKDSNTGGCASVFGLPYRMIFCVVTLDSVLLCDTQQSVPFASIENIHYEQLTDASWSSDGKYLMISSIDGFCTIITMDLNKLGTFYVATNSTENMNTDELGSVSKNAPNLAVI